jgi:hypothetical protein
MKSSLWLRGSATLSAFVTTIVYCSGALARELWPVPGHGVGHLFLLQPQPSVRLWSPFEAKGSSQLSVSGKTC